MYRDDPRRDDPDEKTDLISDSDTDLESIQGLLELEEESGGEDDDDEFALLSLLEHIQFDTMTADEVEKVLNFVRNEEDLNLQHLEHLNLGRGKIFDVVCWDLCLRLSFR
jgi:hypothetical protein